MYTWHHELCCSAADGRARGDERCDPRWFNGRCNFRGHDTSGPFAAPSSSWDVWRHDNDISDATHRFCLDRSCANAGHANAGHACAGQVNAGHVSAGHASAGHASAGHATACCRSNNWVPNSSRPCNGHSDARSLCILRIHPGSLHVPTLWAAGCD